MRAEPNPESPWMSPAARKIMDMNSIEDMMNQSSGAVLILYNARIFQKRKGQQNGKHKTDRRIEWHALFHFYNAAGKDGQTHLKLFITFLLVPFFQITTKFYKRIQAGPH